MMKKWLSSLIIFCLSVYPLHPQASTFQVTSANIAAWNLSGFGQIPGEKAETFANVIAYLDPEVLVLTEVNPDFIAAEIVAELHETGICYQRTILDQSASQNISILYKNGVELSNPRFIEDSNNSNPGLRKALVADMRIGEFDFILISVHLKAGRNSSSQAIRDNQAHTMADFIHSVAAGDEKDVLVVGDYNMIPVLDQSNFDNMNPGHYLNFISDSLAGQFSHIGSSGPGNLLDGFAISREHTSEYITGSIRIIQMHEILDLLLIDYRNAISDHLPVEAAFRITEDDD